MKRLLEKAALVDWKKVLMMMKVSWVLWEEAGGGDTYDSDSGGGFSVRNSPKTD